MNERIRELAEQANGPNPFFGQLKGQMVLVGNDAVEKFAELIVRECVSALQTKIDDGDGYGSYEAGVHRGFIGARNIIKKHFGVE